MKTNLFLLGLLLLAGQTAFAHGECDNLDGNYQEETGLFTLSVRNGVPQTTGKVSYNGRTFYFRYREPMYWDARWNGCVSRTYFQVGGCHFPVLGYLRKKITSDREYISGTVTPTEIYAGSCRHMGNTDRKYTVVR